MRLRTLHALVKLAVFVGACLFLSSCAGVDTASVSRINEQWKGHPLTEAIGKWGTPMEIKKDENGAPVYTWWFYGKGYTYNQYLGSETHYTGEAAEYHSDGHITYTPTYATKDYYKERQGSRICMTKAHTDPGHMINYLEIQDLDGGCSYFFSSDKAGPPDAATAEKGKVVADKFAEIKSLIARRKALCAKPEYAALFEASPCDNPYFNIAGARTEAKMSPEQKRKLFGWSLEMNALIDDYLAFFHRPDEPILQQVVGTFEKERESNQDKKFDKVFLFHEHFEAMFAQQLEKTAKDFYANYIN